MECKPSRVFAKVETAGDVPCAPRFQSEGIDDVEGLGGLQVDHQLEFALLLNGQIGRLGALESPNDDGMKQVILILIRSKEKSSDAVADR